MTLVLESRPFDALNHTSIPHAFKEAMRFPAVRTNDNVRRWAADPYSTADDWLECIPQSEAEFWRRFLRLCELWPWMWIGEKAADAGFAAYWRRDKSLAAEFVVEQHGPEEASLYLYLCQSGHARPENPRRTRETGAIDDTPRHADTEQGPLDADLNTVAE